MNAEKFYTVWCENGGTPTVMHSDHNNAKDEARRLAKLNPSLKFWVMESLGYMQVHDPVQWVNTISDLPF
jgi:hypothetical protein